jgi:ergothioneine biosynthesis protein EgtB
MDGLTAWPPAGGAGRAACGELAEAFWRVRAHTEFLASGLSPEDQGVQSMPDASPAKWHRAHTTWFFETFVARAFIPGYAPFDERFGFLFNSYYETLGARHPRPARGLLTRPSAGEVTDYRAAVDASITDWLAGGAVPEAARDVLVLGLQHEQQHQELLVSDILHAFAQNPLCPAAIPGWRETPVAGGEARFVPCAGGIVPLGARPPAGVLGFCFDNEMPRHRVLLVPYALASHLVTNAAFAEFIADGGYGRASLWMSDGWDKARQCGWEAPLYWRREAEDASWQHMTPGGLVALDPSAPVRHVSWYEADAFSRWAGARLPSEAEIEAACLAGEDIADLVGHVWQWTNSAYLPYPGFRPDAGAVGEYNGKFMVNQMVLRGGSAATPPDHARPTYRNFFHPEKRWQFTGIRLAKG